MANRPTNPPSHPSSLTVLVKLPYVEIRGHPTGPKGAVNLNKISSSLTNYFIPTNLEHSRNILEDESVQGIKDKLRKKGRRGLLVRQLSTLIVRICPKCKEIGNPVIEFEKQYRKVRDNPNNDQLKILVLFYNHSKGSEYERCRICKVEGGTFIPFEKSLINLQDLILGSVLRHISKKDKGYEKYAQMFDIRG